VRGKIIYRDPKNIDLDILQIYTTQPVAAQTQNASFIENGFADFDKVLIQVLNCAEI
jgi:hypothetical protein